MFSSNETSGSRLKPLTTVLRLIHLLMVLLEVLNSSDQLISLPLGSKLGAETSLGELGSSLEGRGASDLNELHHVALIRGEASDFPNDLANEGLLATTLLGPDSLDLGGHETFTTSCSNTASSHDY